MRVSSGVTSYLYDIHRQPAQKRSAGGEVSGDTKSSGELAPQKKTMYSPVEQVVEGEILEGLHEGQVDQIFRAAHAYSEHDEQSKQPGKEQANARSGYAIHQYQATDVLDDRVVSLGMGHQIDLYV